MKIVVINLERRPDRLKEMQEQAAALGFEFELFKAIDGEGNPHLSNGHWGCYQSHKALLERHETMLVLEDDAVLNPYFIHLLDWWMKELPNDWDLLYLGGWKQDVRNYSEHLQIAERVLCTHAYIVRDKFCKVLLKEMESINKIDICFSRAQGNKFITNPVLATQRESFSDIEHSVTTNDHLI